MQPRIVRLQLEARRKQPENLHRRRRQHEEREEQKERAVNVRNVVPFSRIARGTREPGRHEQPRHDEGCEHDDVKIGDKAN